MTTPDVKITEIQKAEIYRIIWLTAAVAALIVAGLAVVRPFLPSIVLAVIFAVSTWPVFQKLKARLKGKTTLAAAIMTVILSLAFIVPAILLGDNITNNFAQIIEATTEFFRDNNHAPPAWFSKMPYFGANLEKLWNIYISDISYWTRLLKNNLDYISQFLLKAAGAIGQGVIYLALSIFFVFFIFRHEEAVLNIRKLLQQAIGRNSERLLNVSKDMMTGIVYGLIGTALAQAVVAGIGFSIANIPGPVFLALLIFLLSPVPIGPPLVWVPATIWLFSHDQVGYGIFMFFWGLLGISAVDNLLRPLIISYGSRMPLPVVFVGVAGGVLVFGFVGLFIGPVILTLIYVLLLEKLQKENLT
jgi:predicted PurR-regulated permease PerM